MTRTPRSTPSACVSFSGRSSPPAGGTHDDWDAFDRAMADERRAVVLVTPHRIYGVTR